MPIPRIEENMKITEVKPNIEYLAITPHMYAHKNMRNPETVQESHNLAKVVFLTLTKYRASDLVRPDTTHFTVAEKGDRSTGLLAYVEATQKYMVIPARNVVGEAEPIEKRWASERIIKQQQELEQRQKTELLEARRNKLNAEAQQDYSGVLKVLFELSRGQLDGRNVTLDTYMWRYGDIPENPYAKVTLPLKALVRIVNDYLELKDEVA